MNTVIDEVKNGAYVITLNRPERKNALNAELLADLRGALENAGEQGNPVIVIRGSGGSFSAGGDIGEFRELVHRGESLGGGAAILHDCVMIIRRLEAITIAVLEGTVAGAGVGISLVCDLSVASKDAVMRYSGATFLANNRIPVNIDSAHAIAHNKIMIIDGQTVITGSPSCPSRTAITWGTSVQWRNVQPALPHRSRAGR